MSSTFGDPIHVYTVEQAIADGVFTEVTPQANDLGLAGRVVATPGVLEYLTPSEELEALGYKFRGCMLDLVMSFTAAKVRHGGSKRFQGAPRLEFEIQAPVMVGDRAINKSVSIVAAVNYTELGEPVLTFFLPHED